MVDSRKHAPTGTTIIRFLACAVLLRRTLVIVFAALHKTTLESPEISKSGAATPKNPSS